MESRYAILVLLLASVLIIVYILIGNNPLGINFLEEDRPFLKIREDFISTVEEITNLDLQVEEMKFWPLNRIVLKNVRISGEELFFSAPEIKIYYNLSEIIKYPEKWLSALTYVKMDRPKLIISQEIEDLQNLSVFVDDLSETDSELVKQLSAIDIYFQEGLISIQDNQQQLQLTHFTGVFAYKNNQQFNLELETDLTINGSQFNDYLQQYDLNLSLDNLSLETIKLAFRYNKQQWQADIYTDALSPRLLSKTSLITEISSHSRLKIGDVSGRGETFVTLAGKGSELETYQGQYNLTKGQALINYGDYIISERIKQIRGQIFVNSEMAVVKDFSFSFSDNPYDFKGKIHFNDRGNPYLEGILTSTDMQLSAPGIRNEQLQNLDISGSAQFKLWLQGDLFQPDFDLEFYLGEGQFKQESINYLKTNLRYRGGMVYVDFFDLNINKNTQISLNGIVDSESSNYSFNLQTTAVATESINNYLNQFTDFSYQVPENLNGKLNLDLLLTGNGFDFKDLNILGDIAVISPGAGYNEINKIESKCWLADKKLILDKGNIAISNSSIEFSGEVDLVEEKVNLHLTGAEISVEVINNYLEAELPSIMGNLDFSGNLTGVIDSPHLNLELAMSEGKFMDYEFDDLKAIINYHHHNIEVEEILIEEKGAVVTGSGMINLKSVVSRIKADLSLKNLEYSFLDRYFDFSLPLTGSFTAQLQLGGPLSKPVLTGQLSSQETELYFSENNYLLDQLQLDFSWQQDAPLQVDQLELVSNNTTITASGEIDKDILKLQYNLNQLQLTQLPLEYRNQLTGEINASGMISGKFTDPEITGKITASKLKYEQRQLDSLTAEFKYYDQNLEIDKGYWQPGTSSYKISGTIQKLQEDPYLDVRVETKDGRIPELVKIIDMELPIKLQGYVQGYAEIKGSVNNPEALLDIKVYNHWAPESLMTVKGKLGKELDLMIDGNKVAFSQTIDLQGRKLDFSGKTSFSGSIYGNINKFNLELETLVTDSKVNQFKIDKIMGTIAVNAGNIISIDQTLDLPDESTLKAKGDILLDEEVLLDLTFKLNRVSLGLISETLTSSDNLGGDASGEIRIAGNIDHPQLGGHVSVRNGTLNIITAQSVKEIKGSLLFKGQTIHLEDVSGIYAREKISASGEIKPFQRENFWNLSLSGSNLPFTHGSFMGRFDAEKVKLTGALLKPLISGELLTHDFIVSMPFSWPTDGKETDNQQKSFTCEYDLVLYPVENVYFESNNHIDVLIQEGSLHLTYLDEELNLEGQLASNQGSFDYYNNKFILDSGRVRFERYEGYIPTVHARASTVIDGIKIIVTVDGPADNMMTTFTSQPALSEEEILDLLASKGGLGRFVQGEEDVFQIISQEFMRFFQERLQLGLVKDIEEKFKEIFELDRMEIDTYDLGWSQDINLYLGKRLSDKFYLEYTGRFTPDEREDEISFRYYLDDSLHVEGSWFGNDEFQLSIEKSIEF